MHRVGSRDHRVLIWPHLPPAHSPTTPLLDNGSSTPRYRTAQEEAEWSQVSLLLEIHRLQTPRYEWYCLGLESLHLPPNAQEGSGAHLRESISSTQSKHQELNAPFQNIARWPFENGRHNDPGFYDNRSATSPIVTRNGSAQPSLSFSQSRNSSP